MRFQVPGLLVFLLAGSCNSNVNNIAETTADIIISSEGSAKGFTITEENGDYNINIKDPWQQAENTSFTYRLVRDSLFADTTGDTLIIGIPVSKVVCLSTTHIGFITRLGMTSSVAGVSGRDLVVSSELSALIDSNLVFDVGYDENVNFELLIDLEPDVVFAYGVNASVNKLIARLKEFGIPVVLVAEYLEEDPLAKMEWIKFFACFYDTLNHAVELFDSVAYEYNVLKEMALKTENKPSVLTGLPWQGTWYISGGSSYIARLIGDAGGSYLWHDMDFRDSRPVGLEKVYERALSADFWINTGNAGSVRDILMIDERFGNLNVIRNRNVFNNNKMLSASGGNDWYETGVTEPNIILADLISILHPQLLPSHQPKYYQRLH